MKVRTWWKWIAVIGLGIAALAVYRPRYRATSEINMRGYESFALAESIVNHKGFSNPFWPLDTGPSAHLAPLFPFYLALILKIFGHGSVAVGVLMWASSLMLALQLILLPFLSRQLGLGFWTGFLAALGWLACGIPPAHLSEATFTALLVVLAAFTMRSSFVGELSAKKLVMSGLVWGALILLQPVVVLVMTAWLLLLHFKSRSSIRQTLGLALLPALVITPWIVRNVAVFHHLVFIRDNLGIELAVSNNSCASALFEINQASGCYAQAHPNLNEDEAVKVQQLGEVEYNRLRLAEALTWMKANPRAFLQLCAQRFELFWVPPRSLNPGNGVMVHPWVLHLFTLLSIPGLLLMRMHSRSGAYVVLLWLAFFPPIYYFVQFLGRYRYPIFWTTFLAGSYFIVELVRGLAGVRETKGEVGDLDPAPGKA